MNDYSEILKDVKFKGFESVSWNKVFKRNAIAYQCGEKHNVIKKLIRIIGSICVDYSPRISFGRGGKDAKILFFQQTGRVSCMEQLQSVVSLCSCADVLLYNGKKKFRLVPIKTMLQLLAYIPSWWKDMRGKELSFVVKLDIVCQLIYLWIFLQKIVFLEIEQYNLFVSYYDSMPFSAYLVECFRRHRRVTASLQHGQFAAWRENVFENSGVEYRSFCSDYLLCWNRLTMQEAKKENIDDSRLVLTGIIGYVDSNQSQKEFVKPCNRVFGVVLTHPTFHDENITLIKAANILAKHIGYKYYLKLHPNYAEDTFDREVDRTYYIGNVPKGIPLKEYISKVEFSMIGSSSMFVELVFWGHDVIRYSNGGVKDKYRDVYIGKIFHEIDEIADVYTKNKDKDFSKELFDLLCSVKNVREAYRNFFAKYE